MLIKFGKISAIISSNILSASFSLSFPPEIPTMGVLAALCLSCDTRFLLLSDIGSPGSQVFQFVLETTLAALLGLQLIDTKPWDLSSSIILCTNPSQ